MAEARRRVNSNQQRNVSYKTFEYEDGSAVRILHEEEEQQRQRRRTGKRHRAAKARQTLARGYVVFLGAVCVLTVVFCVNFLQQKAALTEQYENIAIKESELTRLKDDNDAKYNEVMNSVKLEDVKEKGLNELDMHYADADQIQYFSLPEEGYVRQYTEVPEEY